MVVVSEEEYEKYTYNHRQHNEATAATIMKSAIFLHIFWRELFTCFMSTDYLMLCTVVLEQTFNHGCLRDQPEISKQQNQLNAAFQIIMQKLIVECILEKAFSMTTQVEVSTIFPNKNESMATASYSIIMLRLQPELFFLFVLLFLPVPVHHQHTRQQSNSGVYCHLTLESIMLTIRALTESAAIS